MDNIDKEYSLKYSFWGSKIEDIVELGCHLGGEFSERSTENFL